MTDGPAKDMQPHRSRTDGSNKRVVAFIDSYWLLGRSGKPDQSIISDLNRALGQEARIERVYWYQEQDESIAALPNLPRVSIRTASRDDLDDGYELIRAMEMDLRNASISQRYEIVIVASQDDRLALTLEWVKAQGLVLVGCATPTDEPDPRMQRIFDETLELRYDSQTRAGDDAPATTEAIEIIKSAIAQWGVEVGIEERERTVQYMEKRPGLPRPVDSRLLFIARTKLERELTQGERVTLRRQFRETIFSQND